MLGVSILLLIVYSFIFHKHFDANITIICILNVVLSLAHMFVAISHTVEEAVMGLRLTYIGGCFLLLYAMFLVFNICDVKINAYIKTACIVVSSAVFITSLTIGYSNIFYLDMPSIAEFYGSTYITDKHYGFMHGVFYAVVIIYYLATIGVLIYSFIKKKQVSRKILFLVVLSVTIAFVGFFGGRLISKKLELLPATYNLGMVLYLIIASRLRLYDASDSVTDSLVQKGDTGFISFDHKMRYLGSNETAKAMFPELNNYVVDHTVDNDELGKTELLPLVDSFLKNPDDNKRYIERDSKTYLLNLNNLKVGHFYHGYQFFITDDTVNQEHIKLIKTYNSQLEEEVRKKTAHVQEMQNKLVLGMATMVEGRDNSTGGHIKRTSDCIKFLVEAMKEDNYPGMTEQFCFNLVRAAPMHDLGKIAVDDAILRKPGKFTPEEFEIMKTHAAEGARIVHRILEGTDDVEFMRIAENVAHYHHERWDGSGYPKGLKGEEIPFEARIMAIADVYDALVSKRVYKESMSFEQADKIILEGMGKHFDKRLEPYYIKARPQLENYYKNVE